MNNDPNFFNTDSYSQDAFSLNYQDQYALNNAAIKEKLNLHVKRRLLETIPLGTTFNSGSVNNNIYNSNDDVACEPSKPKNKRGRRSKKTSTITSGILNSEEILNTSNQTEYNTLLTGFGNSNLSPPPAITTNNNQVKGQKVKDKDKNQEMDELIKILNEKKMILMQDPAIIMLLDQITMKLRAKKVCSN